MFRGVRDRKMSPRRSGLLIQFTRPAVEQNQRRTRVFRSDFDVLPADAAAPTCLQSFQGSFFCRETRGIMLRSRGATRFTVSSLGVSEDAFTKPRSALDSFTHAADFDDVNSD